MRVVLAAAAFLLCATAGIRKSLLLRKRRELLEQLSAMLCGFAIEIRCTAPTLDELCERAVGEFADMVRKKRETAADIRSAWESACLELAALPCCKNEEAELMKELGLSLGKSDAAGQLALIELYRERLSCFEKSAAEELSQKGKLFRSLGVLCGIGVAIVII